MLGDEAVDPLLRVPHLAVVHGQTQMSAAGIKRLTDRGLQIDIYERSEPVLISCKVKLPSGRVVVSADMPFKISTTLSDGASSLRGAARLHPSMLEITGGPPDLGAVGTELKPRNIFRQRGPVTVSATLGTLTSKPVVVDLAAGQKLPVPITLEMH